MYTATKVNDTKYLINDTYNDYIAMFIWGMWAMCDKSGKRIDEQLHVSIEDLIKYYENLTAEDQDKNTTKTEHPSTIINLLASLGTIEEILISEFQIKPNELQYNNTLHSEIMIGYFKNDPDGDQETELSESNFSMTYQHARNSLLNRIKNMLESIDTKDF